MPAAVVDTTVLYAAGNRNTQRHDTAIEIVRAADRGTLPTLHVPDVVLVETMNGLTRDVEPETAIDMLDRLETSTGFTIDTYSDAVWSAGLDVFRSVDRLSLADAVITACIRDRGFEYLYGFDEDFDGLEGFTRLAAATDPYDPE